MSIFTKSISQLTSNDLDELLQENAVENVRLEFKLEVPGKDETLKKLSSFANTFGGFLVIGAKADSNDGRLDGLPGVEPQSGYKQTIVQWCFGGVTPPLNAEVSDAIPGAKDAKVWYVIYVAESDLAPHFINGRKGVYVRTDEFSARFEARLANENELQSLLDRRKVVRERRSALFERAQKRFRKYAAASKATSSADVPNPETLLQFCVVPRFPSKPLCEIEELKTFITDQGLSWRHSSFPQHNGQVVFQHESALVLDATGDISMFEASVWGGLFYCSHINEDHGKLKGIHVYQVVGTVLLFVRHAGQMLSAMGYSGPILIETALSSIIGADWLYPMHGMFLNARRSAQLDDEVAFSVESTIEALGARPDAIAMQVLRSLFFAVNWPEAVRNQQGFENLIRKGYEYNFWTVPEKLAL
jgi:hypothetical protein